MPSNDVNVYFDSPGKINIEQTIYLDGYSLDTSGSTISIDLSDNGAGGQFLPSSISLSDSNGFLVANKATYIPSTSGNITFDFSTSAGIGFNYKPSSLDVEPLPNGTSDIVRLSLNGSGTQLFDGGTFTDNTSRSAVNFDGFLKDNWWDYELVPQPVFISGLSGVLVADDATYNVYISPSVYYNYDISIPDNRSSSAITYNSSNTSVASINSLGNISYVSDGTSVISISSNDRSANTELTFQAQGGTTTSSYVSPVSGSVRYQIENYTNVAVSGQTSASMPMFSTRNDTTATYVRNTSCWASGIDFTFYSPWNSYGANQMGVSLVTPKHIIMASHFSLFGSATIRFVDNSNVVHTASLKGVTSIGSTDISVGLLDFQLPLSIKFAKVLPSGWASYFPNGIKSVFCVGSDQEKKAILFQTDDFRGTYNGYPDIYVKPPSDLAKRSVYENIISGDSGSPLFLVINNEVVLLSTWHYADGGPMLSTYINEINAAILRLGSDEGFTVTQVDLSGFSSY